MVGSDHDVWYGKGVTIVPVSKPAPPTEQAQALRIAIAVLDRHDLDPDADIAVLARQFLRLHSRFTAGG
jgi:hypothetical protein